MADSFQGVKSIIVQPGSNITRAFTFAACSSAIANDGSIPYGVTIASAAVKAFAKDGTDSTTDLIVSSSTTTLVVSVRIKYPVTGGAGRYSLEMVLTFSDGQTEEYDFTRVHAMDIT